MAQRDGRETSLASHFIIGDVYFTWGPGNCLEIYWLRKDYTVLSITDGGQELAAWLDAWHAKFREGMQRG